MTQFFIFRTPTVILLLALATIAAAQPKIRTQEEATRLAQAFLVKEQASPPSLATVTERNSLMLQKAGELNIGKTETLKDDYGSALAYVQQLQPQGFIIISADERITPVLAFSFNGELSIDNTINNPLLDLVVADVHARKRLSFAHEPLMQPARLTQWGPLLQTTWTQGEPWSNQCPYAKQNTSGVRRPVGCVATAMAQIVNYWKYPQSVQFSDDEYIYISGTHTSVKDATGWGMPTIAQLRSNMSSLSYNVNPSEEGYLSFASGVKLHMNYSPPGSSANTYAVRDVLNTHFGFGSATAYSERSGVWSLHSSDVIEDIKNGWPVQIAIHKSGGSGGHSIVVDGYRDDGYFHLNYGWGANSPGSISTAWYNVPTNMPRYDVVHTVVYGIANYQGWNQYGADERNTFGSVYAAPGQHQVMRKWRASCPSDFYFNNILVGTSEHVYAAASPNASTGHPMVYLIDQFGTIRRQIELGRDGKIEFMCQSRGGDLFAAMENGYVYRVDVNQGSATQIFKEPNGDDIYALKIDEDGWLFAATFYRVYALTGTGAPRWSAPFVVPSNTMMLGGGYIPSIDKSKQRIYVTYYNSSTKHAFLAAINRLNGQIAQTRDFGTISLASFRAASVGNDGTVYVRMPGTLYALNPNDLLGTPRWTKSLNASTTPALGSDGTLYFAYWEQIGSTWYNKLGAFDPVNGAMRWSKSFQLNPDEEDIFQPYVAGNGVVIFTIEHAGSPKTYTLHGYKDNGTSCEELWQYNAGVSGGDYALGPGRTLYAWGKTGLARTIYAISDGDKGDPYGAGMDFENNSPPASPSNPSTAVTSRGQDTATVQLSWNCSDPDGHTLKYSVFACALIDSQEAAFVPVATNVAGNSYKLTGLGVTTPYLWSVVATDGQAVTEGPVWSFRIIDDIRKDNRLAGVPDRFDLRQNFPNPFNPSTTIQYDLPKPSRVTLIVCNVLGQVVEKLVDEHRNSGSHQVIWNASNVPSGIYFYRLQAWEFVETKKMVVVK